MLSFVDHTPDISTLWHSLGIFHNTYHTHPYILWSGNHQLQFQLPQPFLKHPPWVTLELLLSFQASGFPKAFLVSALPGRPANDHAMLWIWHWSKYHFQHPLHDIWTRQLHSTKCVASVIWWSIFPLEKIEKGLGPQDMVILSTERRRHASTKTATGHLREASEIHDQIECKRGNNARKGALLAHMKACGEKREARPDVLDVGRPHAWVHFVTALASLLTDERMSLPPLRARNKHFKTICEHFCHFSNWFLFFHLQGMIIQAGSWDFVQLLCLFLRQFQKYFNVLFRVSYHVIAPKRLFLREVFPHK